jgi:hypothetical protein
MSALVAVATGRAFASDMAENIHSADTNLT